MARSIDDVKKTHLPDSDQSARQQNAQEQEEENWSEVTDVVNATETSDKSGKHSTVEKPASSRPEFSEGRGARPVSGAFGVDKEEGEEPPGSKGA